MVEAKKSIRLNSIVQSDGVLKAQLERIDRPSPGADEVVIEIQAAPINPSDLGAFFAGADLSSAKTSGTKELPILTAPMDEATLSAAKQRLDVPVPVGNEGAGLVVETGDSPAAQELMGKTVAALGGGMYAKHRCLPARACLVLEPGVTSRDGASCFVNPLTALGMVETMRLEGHAALVHTAAASNLGQMLIKLCAVENVPLVNIVRTTEQVDLLRNLGASFVCNSSAPDFLDTLTEALGSTKATLAFDAVGGGVLASQILTCMERVAGRNVKPSERYGSTEHKQVYLYGMLNTEETRLDRTYGMAWGIGGWLMPNFLARIGNKKAQELRQRVSREIKTIFASHYTQEISLADALDSDMARRYLEKSTGEKYLINPSL